MAKLADLIAAAQRAAYELELPDGTSLSFPQPDVDTWTSLAEADTITDVLRVMAADQADALLAAIGTAPAPVLQALAEDMRKAWGLGN